MKTDHKLYDGEIVLTFDDVYHKYTLNGKPVDGVSNILKQIATSTIEDWSAKTDLNALRNILAIGPAETRDLTLNELDEAIEEALESHKKERDGKADIGKEVHRMIEAYIKNEEVLTDDREAARRFNMFKQWADENVSRFLESERVVYSRKGKYCGTLDFTCFLKNHTGMFVGDIKNTKYIYAKHFLQTAAYQNALHEEMGVNIEGRIIVRIGQEELETAIRTTEFKSDYATFQAIHKVNKWLKITEKDLMKR